MPTRSTLTKKMLNAEVTTGGVKSVRHIDAPAFHGNEFEQLAVSSAHDTSTAHRRARWEQLRPATMADLHAYLADDADPAWPVWRNGTAPDPCWTEVGQPRVKICYFGSIVVYYKYIY